MAIVSSYKAVAENIGMIEASLFEQNWKTYAVNAGYGNIELFRRVDDISLTIVLVFTMREELEKVEKSRYVFFSGRECPITVTKLQGPISFEFVITYDRSIHTKFAKILDEKVAKIVVPTDPFEAFEVAFKEEIEDECKRYFGAYDYECEVIILEGGKIWTLAKLIYSGTRTGEDGHFNFPIWDGCGRRNDLQLYPEISKPVKIHRSWTPVEVLKSRKEIYDDGSFVRRYDLRGRVPIV